nr:RNA-directed DNA polymerase, eukaryota, reverse transcriptase zinc-binding domain protein [Tanacetum cinerariifolium]
MSLYKAPKCVYHELERHRNNFFKGGDSQDSKITWVAWAKVLSSKKNGGLGVSSFSPSTGLFFLNGYGDTSFKMVLYGDGLNTRFWFDTWILDLPLTVRFPRLFALEHDKDISVAAKWSAPSFDASFRRQVKDGVERNQWSALLHMLGKITLSSSFDRYFCDLNGEGAYRVKDIRFELDDLFLPSSAVATRWVNLVPIKVNIFAWRVSLDRLRTQAIYFSLANWVKVFLKEFVIGETFNGRRSRLSLIGLLGSVLIVFRQSLKPCWRVFSTLLGGMSGPFGI